MVKVTVEEDCGNSPRKLFIRDMTIAFVNDDREMVLNCLADNIHWEAPGDWEMTGKTVVAEHLPHLMGNDVVELIIKNIISHGNRGASDGILYLQDGHIVSFCDVYRFDTTGKNAKIDLITSYVKEYKRPRLTFSP